MSQTFYFAVFIGLLGICAFAMLMWQPPKRSCPQCGRQITMHRRRCPYCEYMFSKA